MFLLLNMNKDPFYAVIAIATHNNTRNCGTESQAAVTTKFGTKHF